MIIMMMITVITFLLPFSCNFQFIYNWQKLLHKNTQNWRVKAIAASEWRVMVLMLESHIPSLRT